MATPDALQTKTPPATGVVILSALALLAGASGLTLSLAFLASADYLDFIAGAVGFIVGGVLFAVGLLSLAMQSRSPRIAQTAADASMCLLALLPPLVALLTWPVIYFGLFIPGFVLIPAVVIACVAWSWNQSRTVAKHLSALFRSNDVALFRGILFTMQAVAVLASWPLFIEFLDLLASMGYKVGWG